MGRDTVISVRTQPHHIMRLARGAEKTAALSHRGYADDGMHQETKPLVKGTLAISHDVCL